MSREAAIEDVVMARPEALGFPGARAIRNCRVAVQAGRVDVVLLPIAGETKLVLVEAKVSTAGDAGSKVIGQLLMYYTGALMLGSTGLERMRDFAENDPERARSLAWISPKRLTGGLSPPDRAWQLLCSGTRLTPPEVKLFIALDGESHRALMPTLEVLQTHHGLDIGVVVVTGTAIERVR